MAAKESSEPPSRLPASEAISWPQAFAILNEHLDTSPEEVALWVSQRQLHAYSPELRNGYRHEAVVPFFDEPEITTAHDILARFRFEERQIRDFVPTAFLSEADAVASLSVANVDLSLDARYYNPSGRYVSFNRAVEFLLALKPLAPKDSAEIEGYITRETELERIAPRHPFGHLLSDRKQIRNAWYAEGAILMLAKEHWGAELSGWDAVTASCSSTAADVAVIGKPATDTAPPAVPNLPGESPKYIPYSRALVLLRNRLKATPAEVAGWVWFGPEDGGLCAYRNANQLSEPPRFFFSSAPDSDRADYLKELARAWFLLDDIAGFEPTDRYVTGAELRDRWSQSVARIGISLDAYVLAKIEESRLKEFHPIMGGTRWSADEEGMPPKESALFVLGHVETIENEDGIEPAQSSEQESRNDSLGSDSDTGGMVAWQAVVVDSWEEIATRYGRRPAARKVLKWIKENGPRDTIPAEQPDRDSLRWIDSYGNQQTVTLKSVGNRLSEWREAGKIPG